MVSGDQIQIVEQLVDGESFASDEASREIGNLLSVLACHLVEICVYHLLQEGRASGPSRYWVTGCSSAVRARATFARIDSAVAVHT